MSATQPTDIPSLTAERIEKYSKSTRKLSNLHKISFTTQALSTQPPRDILLEFRHPEWLIRKLRSITTQTFFSPTSSLPCLPSFRHRLVRRDRRAPRIVKRIASSAHLCFADDAEARGRRGNEAPREFIRRPGERRLACNGRARMTNLRVPAGAASTASRLLYGLRFVCFLLRSAVHVGTEGTRGDVMWRDRERYAVGGAANRADRS